MTSAKPRGCGRELVVPAQSIGSLEARHIGHVVSSPGGHVVSSYSGHVDGCVDCPGCCHIPGGWRHFQVTSRHTVTEFAQCMQALVDAHFPEAEVIRVVLDNLNTHTPTAFPAAEARRLTQKLEFHYTPKHGSWLNMVEIEFSVLVRSA